MSAVIVTAVPVRELVTPGVRSWSNGIAVAPAASGGDSTVLVTDGVAGSHELLQLRVRDGAVLRRVGGPAMCAAAPGDASGVGGADADAVVAPRFCYPCQVSVCDDGSVLVCDAGHHRVVWLSAGLAPLAVIGDGALCFPGGVCSRRGVVVVAESWAHRVTVYRLAPSSTTSSASSASSASSYPPSSSSSNAVTSTRTGGGASASSERAARPRFVRVRSFGGDGKGDGELEYPFGICFDADGEHVAVAEARNARVSVFTLAGEFVRHVGAAQLALPMGVAVAATPAAQLLLVADRGTRHVHVFDWHTGTQLLAFGDGDFAGVAVAPAAAAPHSGGVVVFAQECSRGVCCVFDLSVSSPSGVTGV
jgi:DNA-binding beta-propeller fold protein YncE